MAIPSLPTAKNTSDIIDNAWVGAVRALLELNRDTRPRFQGIAQQVTSTNGTGIELAFSDGSGSFNNTPTRNIGSWTAATAGGDGIVVPETGDYMVGGWATYDASTGGGVRRIELTDDTAVISMSKVTVTGVSSATVTTELATPIIIRSFTAGDVIGVRVTQTTSGNLNVTGSLTALWVGS